MVLANKSEMMIASKTISNIMTEQMLHILFTQYKMYVCMCACMYVCMYVCAHVYMYVCIYVCMYVCISS